MLRGDPRDARRYFDDHRRACRRSENLRRFVKRRTKGTRMARISASVGVAFILRGKPGGDERIGRPIEQARRKPVMLRDRKPFEVGEICSIEVALRLMHEIIEQNFFVGQTVARR